MSSYPGAGTQAESSSRSSAAPSWPSPVLVGRHREIRSFREALLATPSITIVEGEAGVGKSRLLQEVEEQVSEHFDRVLRGWFRAGSENFSLAPLIEALGTIDFAPLQLSPLAGALRPLLPEKGDHLPPGLEPPPDPGAERHRLFRALVGVLGSLDRTCLFLEDLHWADSTSAAFLKYLAGHMPNELSVVLSCRPDNAPLGSPGLTELTADAPVRTTTLSLSPLGLPEVQSLIGSILGSDVVSDDFASLIFEKTGGIPFAVEEVLRLLVERKDLIHQDGAWRRRVIERIAVPPAIRVSIVERLSRLSQAAGHFTMAAAVVGARAREDVVLDVAATSTELTSEVVFEAVSSGLLREDERGFLHFGHDLSRQAVYESVLPPVCRRLHLRAARALLGFGAPVAGQIAQHYAAAGRHREAVRFAKIAADVAERRRDFDTAHTHLELAVQTALEGGLPVADLSIRLGESGLRTLRLEPTVGLIRRVLKETDPDAESRGRCHLLLGRLLGQWGKPKAAAKHLLDAIPLLVAVRPEEAANAMCHLALPWVNEGDIDSGLGWLQRAARVAETASNKALSFKIAVDEMTLLLDGGYPQAWGAVAHVLSNANPDRGTASEVIRAYVNVADGCYWLGYPRLAYAYCRDAKAMSEEMLSNRWRSHISSLEFLIDWSLGHWDGLESRVRAALESGSLVGALADEAGLVLALLHCAQAGDGGTEELEALSDPERTSAVGVVLVAAAALMRTHRARGRNDDAIEVGERAAELAARKGLWGWAGDLAIALCDVFICAGEAGRARALLSGIKRGVAGFDRPGIATAAQACSALLCAADGALEEGRVRLETARSEWRSLGTPYVSALAQERFGWHINSHEQSRAAMILEEAERVFIAIGASSDARRVRDQLGAMGRLPRVGRRGRRGYGDALTPREAEVVRLASTGLSNQEIASTLFISARTVEVHLSRGLRKLGVSRKSLVIEAITSSQDRATELI